MKSILAVCLVFAGNFASAASFPVGTFSCQPKGFRKVTFSISELMVGNETLPLVDLSDSNGTRVKGIATVVEYNNYLSIIVNQGTPERFVFKNGDLLSWGTRDCK